MNKSKNKIHFLCFLLVVFCFLVVLLSLRLWNLNKGFSRYEKKVMSDMEKIKEDCKHEKMLYKNIYILTKSLIRKKIPFKIKSEKYGYYIRDNIEYDKYFVFLNNTKECPKCKKRYFSILKGVLNKVDNRRIGIFNIASYDDEHVSMFYLGEDSVPIYFVERKEIKRELGTEDFTVILFTDNKLNIRDIYKPICTDEYIRRFKEWVREKIE